MVKLNAMLRGARKLVRTLVKVQPGEKVLVVTDTGRSIRIGEVVYRAAREVNASVVKLVMEPGDHPGAEVPDAVAAAMKASDVIIGLTTMSLYHTKARLEACSEGARFLACTEISEDILTEGGIEADFEAQRPLVLKIARQVSEAHELRLTTAGGTDIFAHTGGRRAYAFTGLAHKKGEAMGLSNIEVCIAPLEGTGEGTVVVDASATGIGLVSSPIKILFNAGRAEKIVGGEQANQLLSLIEKSQDPNNWNLAEIAIGLNPKGRVTGHIIEDEGTLGTCHVALGNNLTLGGDTPAASHIDLVMWKPTLYLDGEEVFCAE